MAVNQYVNNYSATNEQGLVEDLIIESIQMKGLDIIYLPRTHQNFDYLYGEDPTSAFLSSETIEMYPANVDGFGGDGEMFGNFGIEINDTATFIVSKKRFEEIYPTLRPSEGDLMFNKITNAILEIKFVDFESPFFEKGKTFVYEIKCELFTVSHEEFSTGDLDVDTMVDDLLVPDPTTQVESFGDNDEIATDIDSSITFDPSNPFGVG